MSRRWTSIVVAALAACTDDPAPTDDASTSVSTTDAPSTTSSGETSATTEPGSSSSSTGGESSTGGSSTGAPVDPCRTTAFCEDFEDYTETALVDGQTFGPWRASIMSPGATMDLDGTHVVSGERALHVRLEQGTPSGGRLFGSDGVPLLGDTPTHVYGRMMMFIEQNGTSVHWTFFGVQGQAEPASPLAGNYAAYIMSSLPADGVNTYSFVDGLDAGDVYQDCSTQGETPMPTGEWTCISFEMDSLARLLRMWKDGDENPIVAVDDHGNACVPPTPNDATWWGPEIDELFVGSWSFHPMNDVLEVWIDDLVVDTSPVACP